MRIISERPLREFWRLHPDARRPLLAWCREVESENWDTPGQIRAKYRSASFVADNRVVFNIKGNDYRLVVWVNYRKRLVYIKWVGSHEDYNSIDSIDVARVEI